MAYTNAEFDFSNFRENLKSLMDSRGKTRTEISEEMNMTKATLSRYVTGARIPELKYVIAFAEYFGVSTDWLLGIEGGKKYGESEDAIAMYNTFKKAMPVDQQAIKLILSKYDGQF